MPDAKEFQIKCPRLQHRCGYCGQKFQPHPRLGDRQKTCGREPCRKTHHANYRRRYRAKNVQAEQDIQKKRKEERSPDFWKRYRREHPASTARNRANSRLHKQLIKAGLQRQLDIVQLIEPSGQLNQITEFATYNRSLLEECLGKVAA